jgi:hypothetical protein
MSVIHGRPLMSISAVIVRDRIHSDLALPTLVRGILQPVCSRRSGLWSIWFAGVTSRSRRSMTLALSEALPMEGRCRSGLYASMLILSCPDVA